MHFIVQPVAIDAGPSKPLRRSVAPKATNTFVAGPSANIYACSPRETSSSTATTSRSFGVEAARHFNHAAIAKTHPQARSAPPRTAFPLGSSSVRLTGRMQCGNRSASFFLRYAHSETLLPRRLAAMATAPDGISPSSPSAGPSSPTPFPSQNSKPGEPQANAANSTPGAGSRASASEHLNAGSRAEPSIAHCLRGSSATPYFVSGGRSAA
jgi:hypothetical protein